MKLRSWFFTALLVFLCIHLGSTTSAAQEVQVPFDAADDGRGSVFEINRDLRDQLGIFGEYAGFETARLYRTGSGIYSLEITYREGGQITRKVNTLDSAGVSALRSTVRSKIVTERPMSLVDQSGRSHFLWTTALASFLYYGPALTLAFGVDDASLASTTYLLTSSAGFFVPYFITQNSKMTNGMAAGARVGAILGMTHAGLIFGVADVFDGDEDVIRSFYGVSTLLSVAEMGAGIALADKYNISDGRMNLIGVGGMFGASNGQFAGLMLLGEKGSLPVLAGISLAGSIAGMYGANGLALGTTYTTGDAKAMMMGGLTSYLLMGSILAAADAGFDIRLLSATMLLANGAGLYLTHTALGARDLRDVEGNYTIIGTVAGGLLGLGIAVAGDLDGSEAILIPAIGAAGGFATMLGTVGKGRSGIGESETGGSPSMGASGEGSAGRMEFNINPVGLMIAATKADLGGKSRMSLPLAGLSLSL